MVLLHALRTENAVYLMRAGQNANTVCLSWQRTSTIFNRTHTVTIQCWAIPACSYYTSCRLCLVDSRTSCKHYGRIQGPAPANRTWDSHLGAFCLKKKTLSCTASAAPSLVITGSPCGSSLIPLSRVCVSVYLS